MSESNRSISPPTLTGLKTMRLIRNTVLKCLDDFSDNDERLIAELNGIIEHFGSQTTSIILHVLTHLDLSPEDAEVCWQQIIQHRQQLARVLNRSVNLRTAICDYFCSINKNLENPIVVEIHIFEDTLFSAKFDKLTGLYNRAYLEEAIYREVTRAKRYDTEFSILFLDIDDFKLINDKFGHIAGDIVLKEISSAIIDEIRSEDIGARYGGEEIIIILPETGKMTGLILAERIRKKVENLNPEFEDGTIPVTISGGLASFPIDGTESKTLIKYSDAAMFCAKRSGKNTILPYSPNKRHYVRVDFATEVLVKEIILNDCSETVARSCKNLSLTGILFDSNRPYEIGAKVQLQIPFAEFNKTIQAIGTVVRTEYLSPDHYDIGVAFLEMDTSSKNELSKYFLKILDTINPGQDDS